MILGLIFRLVILYFLTIFTEVSVTLTLKGSRGWGGEVGNGQLIYHRSAVLTQLLGLRPARGSLGFFNIILIT